MAVNETVGINLVADTKSLRSQLREATQELARLQDTAGASAQAIAQAAKRAAELKDRIGDAKDTIDAFSPDAKFRAFSASIQGVAGAFAGAQGALALFGVEGENVQKQLLKVQSALALSEGLNSVFGSIDAFKNLGLVIKTNVTAGLASMRASAVSAFATMRASAVAAFTTLRGALIATGIGVFVVALGLIITNFDSIKATLLKLFPGLAEFAKAITNIKDKFFDLIGVTDRAEEALKKYEKTSARRKESLEQELKVLQAAGASEEQLSNKRKEIINADLDVLRKKLKTNKSLSAEEQKQFRDLKNELAVIETSYNKSVRDEAAKAAKKAKDERDRLAKEAREAQKKINEEAANVQREAALSLLDAQTRELKEREEKYQKDRVTVLKSNNKDLTNLNLEREKDIAAINKKYADIKLEAEKKALEEEAKALDEFYKDQEEKQKKANELARQLALEEVQDKLTAIDLKNQELDNDFKEDLLRLENKKTLLEESKNVELSNAELTAAERLKISRDYAAKEKAIEGEITAVKKAEIDARNKKAMQEFDLAQQLGGLLQQIAGKNKELAIAGIVIEQAAGIAKIIQNTATANAIAVAASPLTAGQPWVAYNTVQAGLSIASSIAAGVSAISQINAAGKGSSGSVSAGASLSSGGSAPVAPPTPRPQATSLDARSLNTINNVVARAYVVESDITGSQKRIRRIENAARI
jgi:hypothetical protein